MPSLGVRSPCFYPLNYEKKHSQKSPNSKIRLVDQLYLKLGTLIDSKTWSRESTISKKRAFIFETTMCKQ